MSIISDTISREEDFRRLRQSGRFWKGRCVRLSVLSTTDKGVRTAIIVSKKVSNKAVVRNKFRRQIAAILKQAVAQKDGISADIIVSLLPGQENITFEELAKEIEEGLARVIT